MKVIIKPSKISGTITAPASKSSMQRACAAALIRKGESLIHNPGISNDDLAAISIIKNLGATTEYSNEILIIKSNGIQPISNEINCGESGLSIRMFTPIAALSKHPIIINGEGSLLSRPMNFLDEIFPKLSVDILSNNGKLPLQITGPLQPNNILVDGSLSSQFLTGLLMSFAACEFKNDVTINVQDLKSKPYIDLTLAVMQSFGLNLPTNNNYESFTFHHSALFQNKNSTIHYTVEGDWSGAAFLLVAGAIAGNIIVTGLDVFSTQADKAILKALMDCGCHISIQSEQIEIGSSKLKPFHFDATDCPDLFPPLVALAAYCNGTTAIEGVNRLVHKESNRGLTLQKEFGKLGVEIILQDDLMLVKGGAEVTGEIVHSNYDHRVAMACAVAALGASGKTTIQGADAVNKSYPNFYQHLKAIGVSIKP